MKRNLLVGILGIIVFIYLNVLMGEPAVGIKFIIEHFHLPANASMQITASSLMTASIIVLSAGLLMDIFGTRCVIAFALALAVFGNYLFGYASSAVQLLQGRALIGISSVLVIIGVYKLGSITFSKRYFSIFVGFMLAINMLAMIYLPDYFSHFIKSYEIWQQLVLAMNVIGLILLSLTLVFVSDSKIKIISLDEIFYVISNPRIWLIGIISLCGYLFFSVFTGIFGTLFLKQTLNFNMQQVSSLEIDAGIGFAIGSILVGIVGFYASKKKLILAAGYFLAAILFFGLIYSTTLSYACVAFLLGLVGFFLGTRCLGYILLNESLQSSYAGFGFGILMLIVTYGAISAAPLTGFILTTYSHINSENLTATTYNWVIGLLIVPVALIIGGILTLFLGRFKKQTPTSNTNLFQDLKRYWRGQGRLGRCFWLIYLLGSVMILNTIYPFLIAFGTVVNKYIIIDSILLAYSIFSGICVWRCSKNTTWGSAWPYIARILIVLNIVSICITMVKLLI